MNSFSIKLGTLSQSGAATYQLEIRSCVSEHGDMVELVLVRHKPGPKGGTQTEESLGMLHVANLELSLRGVIVLTGGTR